MKPRGRAPPHGRSSTQASASSSMRSSLQPSSAPTSGGDVADVLGVAELGQRRAAPAGCGAAARRRRSAPARSGRRSRPRPSGRGGPRRSGRASAGSLRGEGEHARRWHGRSGRRAARAPPRAARASVSRSSGRARHAERDVVGPRGRLAAVALDDPVHDLLRHPPPGGELAAGDRQHPRGGLIELGPARDVHGLLRVAGGDQRPHPGVGAGDVVRRQLELEVGVDGVEQVGDVVVGSAEPGRCRRRSRCRSGRPGPGRTRAGT